MSSNFFTKETSIMSYIFAGDFYYKNDNNIGKADVEELMYFHYD